jgi:hypothetical protein
MRIKVSTVTAYPSGWLKERALDVAAAVAVSLNKQKLKKKKKTSSFKPNESYICYK